MADVWRCCAGGKPVEQPTVLEMTQACNPQLALELKLLLRDLYFMDIEGRRRAQAGTFPQGRLVFLRQLLNQGANLIYCLAKEQECKADTKVVLTIMQGSVLRPIKQLGTPVHWAAPIILNVAQSIRP